MIARAILTMSACFATISLAQAGEWRSTDDSEFGFETTFEGVATPGEFTQFSVALDFDSSSPGDGRLRVTVDLTAADMGDPDMNAVLFEPAWFDTQNFETAVFDSSEIVERSPGEFLATGTLDLKGIRKTVNVPFAWTQTEDKAVMAGELTLDRNQFGIGNGEWASGDAIGIDVRLAFTVRLERAD
jgi:polyisoprenoid-binding protein YceI